MTTFYKVIVLFLVLAGLPVTINAKPTPFAWAVKPPVLSPPPIAFRPAGARWAVKPTPTRAIPAAMTLLLDDCERTTVQAAYDAAVDGDVIECPAGTFTWTVTNGANGVTMNADKGLTFLGAGSGESGGTVIIDEMNGYGIRLNTYPTRSYDISNIRFERPGGLTKIQEAFWSVSGRTSNFRFHHTVFDNCDALTTAEGRVSIVFNPGGVNAPPAITGVIDNNHFISGGGSGNSRMDLYSSGWGGPTGCNGNQCENGDGAWVEPANWGTDKFIFLEDNIFESCSNSGGVSLTMPEGQGGLRMVIRFNQYIRANGGGALHGTETGGRSRSPRAIENYFNTYTTDSTAGAGNHRGGGLMAHNNTFTGPWASIWGVRNNRSGKDFGVWHSSDGSNAFDLNDGVIYASGVADAGSDLRVLVDEDAGWTASEWVNGGFSVRDCNATAPALCANGGSQGHAGSFVLSNDHRTLTVSNPSTDAGSIDFNPGDNYIIIRATKVFDAVGRGAGLLVSGSTPTLPNGQTQGTPSPSSWIEQEDEPSYNWLNTINGNIAYLGGIAIFENDVWTNPGNLTAPQIRENRDVFEHAGTASVTTFDGTLSCSTAPRCGVGFGPRSARPASTVNGLAWWATGASDSSSWNIANGVGHDGCLDVVVNGAWVNCNYTPYRYPHPLASGGEDPPTTPILTSLSLTSGTRTECAMGCEVILAGSGFSEDNFAVTISGTDVTNMCMVDSDIQATCDFTIESDAATTARTVTVDTDGGTSNGQTFTVRGPVITSVIPQGVNQDTTDLVVTLTGTDLEAANLDITFDPAADLTADTEACSSSTSCTFELDVAAGAAPGLRTLTWTTFDGADTDQLTIEIVSTGATPSISHITATVGYRGTTVNLTVNGANLTDGTLVTNCPTGLMFSNETVVSDTQITAQLAIGASMELGACDIYVQGASNTAFVDAGGTGANTDTLDPLPDHSAGNIIVQFVMRKDASAGSLGCEVPAGWTEVTEPINPGEFTQFWMGAYYKRAVDAMTEPGVFTGCVKVAAIVLEDVGSIPFGGIAKTSGSSGNYTFGSPTFEIGDGSSWALLAVCDRSTTTTPSTPDGTTFRAVAGTGVGATGSGRCAIFDTNTGVASFAGATSSASSARWATMVIEVKGGGLSNPVTFLPLSQYGAAGGAAIF